MLPGNRIPAHPGEILQAQFLEPLGLTQVALSEQLGVPVQRINEIVRGKQPVQLGVAGPRHRGDLFLGDFLLRRLRRSEDAFEYGRRRGDSSVMFVPPLQGWSWGWIYPGFRFAPPWAINWAAALRLAGVRFVEIGGRMGP